MDQTEPQMGRRHGNLRIETPTKERGGRSVDQTEPQMGGGTATSGSKLRGRSVEHQDRNSEDGAWSTNTGGDERGIQAPRIQRAPD